MPGPENRARRLLILGGTGDARALAETQNSGAWAAGDELAYDEIVEPRELRGRLISAIEIATDR